MKALEPIIIYSTTWCPDCRRAKRFLDERDIPFTSIDIDTDRSAAAKVMELNGGNRSVPTIIFADGTVLVEPSNRELAEKLGVS